MSLIYRVENDNFRVSIYQDEQVDSPRDWDNLGTFFAYHRDYMIGDYTPMNTEQYSSWYDWFENALGHEKFIALPVYCLDHGGLRVNTTGFGHADPGGWDSGQIGWIYVKRSYAQLEGMDEEQVKDVLRQEIETLDQWLAGDVYGFCIERREVCPECLHVDYHLVDSCWGVFGSDVTKNGMLDYMLPTLVNETDLIKQLKEGW